MFCILWAWTKYYFKKSFIVLKYEILKLNLKYDCLKEPMRFFLAALFATPFFLSLTTRNFTLISLSIFYMLLLISYRIYYLHYCKTVLSVLADGALREAIKAELERRKKEKLHANSENNT